MAKKTKGAEKEKKQHASSDDKQDDNVQDETSTQPANDTTSTDDSGDDTKETMTKKGTNDDDDADNDDDDDDDAQTDEPTKGKRKRKRKRKTKSAEDEEKEKATGNNAGTSNSQPSSDLLRETSVDRTVYIEGLPFEATPDQLKEFFGTHEITDVLEMRLPTWQDTGRLRGYGHVVFDTVESHTKALALSGKFLQKRYLTIQAAKAPKASSTTYSSVPSSSTDHHDPFAPPPKDCKTIFCHNLPYHAAEEEISAVFSQFGTIVPNGVRIARNSVNRQSKGFCYVDFEQPDEAKQAVTACATSKIHVGGRLVRVDYDTGRIKGSYKAESGRQWTKHVQKQPGEGGHDSKKNRQHKSTNQQRTTSKRQRKD
jgi:nucleolin